MDMTLEQASGLVRGLLHQHPKGILVRDAWEAIDAHLAQHAAMVAKLRELTSIKTTGKQRGGGDYSRTGVWDVVDPVNWRKEIKLILPEGER